MKNARDEIESSYEIELKLPVSHLQNPIASSRRHTIVAVRYTDNEQHDNDFAFQTASGLASTIL
jgi:hypothetical protein